MFREFINIINRVIGIKRDNRNIRKSSYLDFYTNVISSENIPSYKTLNLYIVYIDNDRSIPVKHFSRTINTLKEDIDKEWESIREEAGANLLILLQQYAGEQILYGNFESMGS